MATTITANGINFPDGSASAPSIGGTDTNTGLFTGSDIVGFATGGVERIKIDAGGRVSIGNNPTVHTSTKFHVEDTGELNVKFEGSTSTLGARISLQNNDTTANSFSQYAFNDAGGQSTSAIQGINTDQTNNYGEMAFLTRNAQGLPPSERVRIDKDGNVGIGTTSPSAKLQVGGATIIGTANTTKTQDGVIIERNSGDGLAHITAGRAGGNYSGMNFYVAGASGVTLRQQIDYQSNFKFFGADGTSERLRITSAGKVGIGTTSPAKALEIKSGMNSDGFSILKGSNSSVFLGHNGSGDEGLLQLKDGGTTTIQIYGETGQTSYFNAGNVGIGTTSPQATLHCLKSGQINLIVGSSDAGGAYLVLDGDANGDSTGGDYAYIGHTTDGDLLLVADNPAGNGHIFLKSNGGTYQAVGCYESGEVQLRYQNTTKLETSSTGVILTSGAANTTSVRFGNTANRGLYISTYQSAGNNDSGVVFNAADSENNGYSATLEFDLGGVEFGRFDGNYDIFKLSSACNGLTFNGDWADANRLDEYEEGSWTVTDLTSDGVTFINQSNRYTRIGRQVFVQANIQFPNSGLSGAAMKMGGLPFAPGTGTTSSGIVSVAVDVSNGNGYANGVQLHIDTAGIHATYDGALRKGGFGNSQFQNRAVCFAFSYST
jgi:hypothetical protein